MKTLYPIEREPWMRVWPMDITKVKGIRRADIPLRLCEEIRMRDNNQVRTRDPIPALHLRVRLGTTREDRLRNNNTPHEIQCPGIIRVVLRQDLLSEMTHIAHSLLQPPHANPCTNLHQIRTRHLSSFDIPPTKSLTLCHELLLKVELCPNAMMTDPCP